MTLQSWEPIIGDNESLIFDLIFINAKEGNFKKMVTTAQMSEYKMGKLFVDNKNGRSIIIEAVLGNQNNFIKIILDAFYKKQPYFLHKFMNHRDYDGMTPLMYAVYHNLKNIVLTLTSYKCDLDIVNNNYETALMIAARTNNTELFDVLVKTGADTEIKNKFGEIAYNLFPKRMTRRNK
jgi:ankyrin repeat protein